MLTQQERGDTAPSNRYCSPRGDRTIRAVFTTDCYDYDPDHPWRFQQPLQKIFLPPLVKEHRLAMASYILRYGKAANWWASEVVWFDPCATILPGSQKQYEQMKQVLKGKKRYISDNAKLYSPNLLGQPTALKQTSWGGKKINWFMILSRGVAHVEIMPATWTLNGAGLASFVDRLPDALRKMMGQEARLPRHIFTDRGTGMYNPAGKIVNEYADAVKRNGFHLYWGRDATRQSPDMGDLVLHETAVSWFRSALLKTKPEVLPWQETQEQWARRARKAIAHINKEYDVIGLCREFPTRLSDVVKGRGERLRK